MNCFLFPAQVKREKNGSGLKSQSGKTLGFGGSSEPARGRQAEGRELLHLPTLHAGVPPAHTGKQPGPLVMSFPPNAPVEMHLSPGELHIFPSWYLLEKSTQELAPGHMGRFHSFPSPAF